MAEFMCSTMYVHRHNPVEAFYIGPDTVGYLTALKDKDGDAVVQTLEIELDAKGTCT